MRHGGRLSERKPHGYARLPPPRRTSQGAYRGAESSMPTETTKQKPGRKVVTAVTKRARAQRGRGGGGPTAVGLPRGRGTLGREGRAQGAHKRRRAGPARRARSRGISSLRGD